MAGARLFGPVRTHHVDALHYYGLLKHQQGQSTEALRFVAADPYFDRLTVMGRDLPHA